MSDNELQINSLKELGLTENQAKAIIGMVKIGTQSDATTIARVSNIPRSKIYLILQQLNELELVEIFPVEGGANYYSCLKIDSIILKLKEISDERITKILSSLDFAEKNLKSLEKSEMIDSGDKLDFIVIKGKDRIIDQIQDSLEEIGQTDKEIIMTIPISISKDVSKAIFQTLINITEKKSGSLNAKILVNSQEYKQIEDLIDISPLRNNFLVVDFEFLKQRFKGQRIGGENTMPFLLINKFETFFSSRPLFIVAGTEAAFIGIGDSNMLSSVKIQRSEFISFQQRFISNLFDLIHTFVKETSFQNRK